VSVEAKRARLAGIKYWYHSIDLGDGVITPGFVPFSICKDSAELYFAMGVAGRSVLDVGAWDGYYSFDAERRGAARVLAADYFCWGGGGRGDRKAFEFARDALGSRVEDRIIDIPQLTVETVGPFDIVLFNGIFYHILNPIGALQQMTAIAEHILIVETYMENLENSRPVMTFLPGAIQPPGYPTNGWGPNSLCMHALFKRLGFETVLEFPTPGSGVIRSVFMAFKPGHAFANFVAANQNLGQPRYTGTDALSGSSSKQCSMRKQPNWFDVLAQKGASVLRGIKSRFLP
jgi:tRNA (mo5U34)-methyltransferase